MSEDLKDLRERLTMIRRKYPDIELEVLELYDAVIDLTKYLEEAEEDGEH